MGINLKSIKVESLKYHLYNGAKEKGVSYDAKPSDAKKMAAKGLVKLVEPKKVKIDKPVKEVVEKTENKEV